MDILLPALAEAILGAVFGILFEDAANRPLIVSLRERVRGPSVEQKALERALQRAFGAFEQQYPEITSAFFDQHFLHQNAVAAELAKLLTPHREPDVEQLERLWQAQFPLTKRSLREPLGVFVQELKGAILAEPDLRPFTDSRTLQAMLQQLVRQADVADRSLAVLDEIAANTRRPKLIVNAPFMAGPRPEHYVGRPQEYEQIIAHLLSGGNQPVAIASTTTLRGAGGFGKTTLAQAICHDERIRSAFPDGILWVTIGDDQARVLPGLAVLCNCLSGQNTAFAGEQEAVYQLTQLLEDRRCLIVVDDVWQPGHLTPFLQGGPNSARLITTRIAEVAPRSSQVVTVEAMETSQAVALLGQGIPAASPTLLQGLAEELFEWPLLLTIVNRRLYEDVVRNCTPLGTAVAEVREQLQALGLTALDIGNEAVRSRAVAACIGASLKHLRIDAPYGHIPIDEAARFAELAIFPEDTAIPIAAVAVLWQQAGGLPAAAAKALCRRLADLSLLLRYDVEAQTILLHDVIRRYLIDRSGPEQYCTWQRALVEGYRARCAGEYWRLPNDGYVYQRLPWHLREAQQLDELEALLQTYRWLSAKLRATSIVSTIADFDLRRDANRHTLLGLLQHALQMSVSVLARDPQQLASQLYGRLANFGDDWWSFVRELELHEQRSWLCPKQPRLTPPGGNLLYILTGHTDGVDNLLLAPEGRLVSACSGSFSFSSDDHTVKVWDVERGVLLHTLEGHTAGVDNLLLAPEGRLVTSCSFSFSSSNDDHTVKVWDIERGVLLHTLEGHTAGVSNLLLTPEGCLVTSCSRSDDHTVKVWDVEHGVLLHTLEGHNEPIHEQQLTQRKDLLVTNGGAQVLVWDLFTYQKLVQFTTDGRVDRCLVAPDHTIVLGDGLGRVHFLTLIDPAGT